MAVIEHERKERKKMGVVIFIICLAASVIGGICGIGGGVIIKPVLDATGLMPVSALSFLSGLTVLGMSAVSVFRGRKNHLVNLRIGSALAVGAVLGGIMGNVLFQAVKTAAGNDSFVGMVQAIVLGGVTVITLLYSCFLRNRIPSFSVRNLPACIAIGMGMGVLSSFLGIGGGPINLAVLYFAFSMDTKKASANSLYIILFSQAASFITALVKGTVPVFSWYYLLLMVPAGVLGGIIGSKVNRRISARTTDKLFYGLLMVITCICIYNAYKFAG